MFESVEPKKPTLVAPSGAAAAKSLDTKSVPNVPTPPIVAPKVAVLPSKVAPKAGASIGIEKFNNNFRFIAIVFIVFLVLIIAGFSGWRYYRDILPINKKIAEQKQLLAQSKNELDAVKSKVNKQESVDSTVAPSLNDRDALIVVLDSIANKNGLSFSLIKDDPSVATDPKQVKFIISGADYASLSAFSAAIATELRGVSIGAIDYSAATTDYTIILNIEAQ